MAKNWKCSPNLTYCLYNITPIVDMGKGENVYKMYMIFES